MKCYGIGQPVHRIQKLFLETVMHHRCPHPHSLSSRSPGTAGKKHRLSFVSLWPRQDCSCGTNITRNRTDLCYIISHQMPWNREKTGLVRVRTIREMPFSFSQDRVRGGSFELCRYPAWLLLQVLGSVFSFQVFIEKQKGEILGVVIVESGWGSILPTVIIANMMHGGPAEKSGKLNIGDQIMSINGTSLVGLPLSTCQSIIKVPARGKATNVIHLRGVTCDCFSVIHLRNIKEVSDPEEGGLR